MSQLNYQMQSGLQIELHQRGPERHTELDVLVDHRQQTPERQLHVHRGAAEDLDIGHGNGLDGPVVRELADAGEEGQNGTKNGRVDGQLYRHPGPLQEGAEIFSPMHEGFPFGQRAVPGGAAQDQ